MANSTITKRAIASSFKSLLEVTPFERITVSAIADECGINRQTFYYHFHDKYDLVAWIIDDDVATNLSNKRGSWQESLIALLTSLKKDHRIALYRMRSADPVIMYRLMKERLHAIAGRALGLQCDETGSSNPDEFLIVDFCTGGMVEVIVTWLENGCIATPEDVVSQLDCIVAGMPLREASQTRGAGQAQGKSA